MTKIAINGFGRIGRGFVRALYESGKQAAATGSGQAELEIIAINDLAPAENLAYLLKYDSVYGRAPFSVEAGENAIIADGKEIPVLAEKDPAKLPWRDLKVDIVVESTGLFTTAEKARAHILAGAKRVVISAPLKKSHSQTNADSAQIDAETVLIGVNEEKLATCEISSNASCTTNAVSPVVGILDEAIGIERAILNTVHAYTASQQIVDGVAPDDFRRGRAAAINMGPSSTGAAKATALAHPQFKGKFDGIAVRVPVASGSLADVTFVAKRATSVEEVNDALRAAAKTDRWKKVFTVTEEPLVSSDILGEPYGAIADLAMTRVVDGTLVKVLAWYDNEMGYAHTLVAHVLEAAKHI